MECEGPELLRAFYKAISTVSVLDPTCGSGAFLFAALNILEPLYDACLDRMQGFIDDLDQSGKRHRPEKFSDFKTILKSVDEHPNRRFFILKSIVVNNLYGVDIMEEAVEICKLRLFLKLVAQVDKVKQLEPLPDIDFNIRSGNTLVGYVTVDEIRTAAETDATGQTKILLESTKDEIGCIEEDAALVERAFKRFHEMQTHHQMDVDDFRLAKEDLRSRLKKLSTQLDQYLAKEYGIDPEKKKSFESWRNSHQPFHWFIEFYGIMIQGGFNIVIGNPPWKEYSSVKKTYKIRGYLTEPCGNLYGICTERVLFLRSNPGRMSFIVQLPLTCSARMKPVRLLLKEKSNNLHVLPFDDRPGKLFEGLQHCRSVIFFSDSAEKTDRNLWTTKYQRWASATRSTLFSLFEFSKVKQNFIHPDLFHKNGVQKNIGIFEKMSRYSDTTIGKVSANQATKAFLFYQEATQYWMKATIGLPYYEKNGIIGPPAHGRYIYFDSIELTQAFCAIINSSLFYYYFIGCGDCFHLTDALVRNFPIPKEILSEKVISCLFRLC